MKAYNNSKYLNYVVSYQANSDKDDFDFKILTEISTNMTVIFITYIFFCFIILSSIYNLCVLVLFVVSAEKYKTFGFINRRR